MGVLVGLILTVCIVSRAGTWASKTCWKASLQRIPQQARTRATERHPESDAGRVAQAARDVRPRPMAEARATNWLERKRAGRARREARPPRTRDRSPRDQGSRAGDRRDCPRPGAVAKRIPRVAVNMPGVTDKRSRPPRTQPRAAHGSRAQAIRTVDHHPGRPRHHRKAPPRCPQHSPAPASRPTTHP